MRWFDAAELDSVPRKTTPQVNSQERGVRQVVKTGLNSELVGLFSSYTSGSHWA